MHQYEALSSETHRFEHSGEHSFTQRTKSLFGFQRFNMDIEVPTWAPKVCWLLHFTFTSWALLSGFITVQIYSFSQLIFLLAGIWHLVDRASAEAAILHFFIILITIVNDIISLSIFTPRGYKDIEDIPWGSQQDKNLFRFALVMAIANLLLKPFTAFLMFKAYSDNGGDGFNINNILGGSRGGSGGGSNNNSNNGGRGGFGPQDSSQGYQNLEADRPRRETDAQSEHQYADLHDDPRDRPIPPRVPARNNPEPGYNGQGSVASSYYSTQG